MASPPTLDDAILDTAGMLRDALGGRLQVFHAGAPWEYTVHMNQEMRDLPKAVKEDVRGAYWNKLEERVLAVARRHHILENSVQVIEGHAADLLPPTASSQSAQIVVLGLPLAHRPRSDRPHGRKGSR